MSLFYFQNSLRRDISFTQRCWNASLYSNLKVYGKTIFDLWNWSLFLQEPYFYHWMGVATGQIRSSLKMSFCNLMSLDDGCSRSCSTAVPNISAKPKKSIHFSKDKENQKAVCIANLQESVKPKTSCEY